MGNDAKDTLAVVPWYWRDWRASSARSVLCRSPIAGWCYRELLDAAWGSETCDLPVDDAELAALAGVTDAEWASVKSLVLRFFRADPATGRLYHPRSRHEHGKAKAYREGCRAGGKNRASKMTPDRRSEIARSGANARWASKECLVDASKVLADAWTPSPSASPSASASASPDQTPDPVPSEPLRVTKPKRQVSPQDGAARALANALGSSLNPCRKQIAALVSRGVTLDSIHSAIERLASPGMAPWDWTKLVTGNGGGLTGDQIRTMTGAPPVNLFFRGGAS